MYREPVLSAAVLAGAIVAIASVFNVVLELGTIEAVIASVLPVLTALFARAKVTPVV